MAGQRRMFKVSERIREIVASQLHHTADPRLSLVTITGVQISSDLREAKVYWNVSRAEHKVEEVEAAFSRAAGYFRNAIGRELDLRFVPRLRFYYDDTLDTYEQVDKLLRRIHEDQPPAEGEADE